MPRRLNDGDPGRFTAAALLFIGLISCLVVYAVFSTLLRPQDHALDSAVRSQDHSRVDGGGGCCRGVDNLELWGSAVKWGTDFKFNSSDECCKACKVMCSGNHGPCLCDSWVFCGDKEACGSKFGECWLKKQNDVLVPDRQEGGQKVMWTSGLIFGQGQGIVGFETEHGVLHVKLHPECAPHSVYYILSLLTMRHCAGCQFHRAENRGSYWDSQGNHINNAPYGPPYAMIQGILQPEGNMFTPIPTEHCPTISRGSVGWVGSGPEFFISLANHHEWKQSYTVFGSVLPEDMEVAERIAGLPTRTDVWNSVNVSVLEKPVSLTVRRMKSGQEQEESVPRRHRHRSFHTTTTRRVPPPYWTDEETAALVNAYKDKWFALRRGNLRAADWDDVAASLPTFGGPAKTATQCRHKIEKLRKRYRGEKQRSLTKPGKFSSSWDLFPVLDAMEFASVTSTAVEPNDQDVDRENESNGVDGFRVRSKRSLVSTPRDGFGVRSRVKSQMRMYGGFKPEFDSDHDSGGGFGSKRRYNGHQKFNADSDDEILLAPKATRLRGSHGKLSSGEFSSGGGGFPLKSYGDRSFASHGFKAKNFNNNFSPEMDYDDDERERFNPRIQNSRRVNGYTWKDGSYPGVSNGYGSSSRLKHEQMNESDPINEVVSSVKMLTEMFVSVEESKMEMEKTRMEMELKHCQMMLESQQQIIGAFVEDLKH
ncbi:unnamed protein product [Brassica oleracea]